MKQYVQIVDLNDGEAVETFDVTEKSERNIEKLIQGIEINLNHADYEVIRADETNVR